MQPKRMNVKRPTNTSLNPNRIYAKAAQGAPLPGGVFGMGARINAIRSMSIFDPGVNPQIAKDVRQRYGFDDSAWRDISETIGTTVGATAGFYKGATTTVGLTAKGATLGPWGAVSGALIGAAYTLGTTLSGAYIGKFVGGLASPSGVVAAGEMIRDVMIGMRTDPIQTATYTGISLTADIITNYALSKVPAGVKINNQYTRRLISRMVSQLGVENIMSITGLLENIDPDRTSLMMIAGNTQSQIRGTSLLRSSLTGMVDKDVEVEDAIKKAYGISEDGYKTYSFVDIRSAVGLDLSLFGNQIVDFIGNTLTDMSLYQDVYRGSSRRKVVDKVESELLKTGDVFFQNNSKHIANFFVENMDRLNDPDTFNKFISLFPSLANLNLPRDTLVKLYETAVNSAVMGLTDKDLDYFITKKQNLHLSEEYVKILQEGGTPDMVDNLILNQFSELDIKKFSKEFNIETMKYTMINNYVKLSDTIVGFAGWADVQNKLITKAYSSYPKLKQMLKKNPKRFIKGSEDGNFFVLDEEKSKEYITNKYQKSDDNVLKMREELEAIKKEKEEKILQAKITSATEINKLTSRIESLEKSIRLEQENINNLREKLGFTQEFTYQGEAQQINEASLERWEKELERLLNEVRETGDREVYKEYSLLKSDVESYKKKQARVFVESVTNYNIKQVEITSNLLRSAYTSFSNTLLAIPAEALDEKLSKLLVYRSGDDIAKQHILNSYKGMKKEQAEKIWEAVVIRDEEGNVLGPRSKDSVTPELLEGFTEEELSAFHILMNSTGNYFSPEGALLQTPVNKDIDVSSNHLRRLYVEQEMMNDPEMREVILKLQSELKEMVTSLEDFSNTYLVNEDGITFDLAYLEDPFNRERVIKLLDQTLSKLTTGAMRDILEGVPKYFENEPDQIITLEVIQALIENLRRVGNLGTAVEAATKIGVLSREEYSKKLIANQESLKGITKVIGVRQSELTRVQSIIDSGDTREIYQRYIKSLLEGDSTFMLSDEDLEYINSNTEEDNPNEYGVLVEKIEDALAIVGSPEDINLDTGVTLDSLINNSTTIEQDILKYATAFVFDPKKVNTGLLIDNAQRAGEYFGVSEIINSEYFRNGTDPYNVIFEKSRRKQGVTFTLDMDDFFAKLVDSLYSDEEIKIGLSDKEIEEGLIESFGEGYKKEDYSEKDFQDAVDHIIKTKTEGKAEQAKNNIRQERIKALSELTPESILDLIVELEKWKNNVDRFDYDKEYSTAGATDTGSRLGEDFLSRISDGYEDPGFQVLLDVLFKDGFVPSMGTDFNDVVNLEMFDKLMGVADDLKREVMKSTIEVKDDPDQSKYVTNVIKTTLNEKIYINGLVDDVTDRTNQITEMNTLDYIINYGDKYDIQKLMRVLTRTYDLIDFEEHEFESHGNKTFYEMSKSEQSEVLNELVNNTHILERGYKSQYYSIERIKNNINNNFYNTQVQKDIPMLEILHTESVIKIMEALEIILIDGNAVPNDHPNMYLNEFLNTPTNEAPYMEKFLPRIKNFNFKVNFVNNISGVEMDEVTKLRYLDYLNQISNIEMFATNPDTGSLVMDERTLDWHLNSRLKRRDFNAEEINPLIEKIKDIRKDIELNGVNSRFNGVSFRQGYDRDFVDTVKNLLHRQMTIYQDMLSRKQEPITQEDGTIEMEPMHEKDPALAMGANLISGMRVRMANSIIDMNQPLTRQANRNRMLNNVVMTQEYFNKNILQQESTGPEDTRLNVRTLIEQGSMITFRSTNSAKAVARAKYGANFYYNRIQNQDLSGFTSEGPMKTAFQTVINEDNSVTGPRYIDRKVSEILGRYNMFKDTISDSPESSRLNDMSTQQFFYNSLRHTDMLYDTDPEFIGLLNYFDENLADIINVGGEDFATLANPLRGFDSNLEPIEENKLKAALARVHMLQNYPSLDNPIEEMTKFKAETEKAIQESKDKISGMREEISNLYGFSQEGSVLLNGYKNGYKVHEVLYNILDNKVPEGDLEAYVKDFTGGELTPEDKEYITNRKILQDEMDSLNSIRPLSEIEGELNTLLKKVEQIKESAGTSLFSTLEEDLKQIEKLELEIENFKEDNNLARRLEIRNQLELDFNNLPPFAMRYLEKTVKEVDLTIEKINEDYAFQISQETDPDKIKNLEFERNMKIASYNKFAIDSGLKHVAEKAGYYKELAEIREVEKETIRTIREEAEEKILAIKDKYGKYDATKFDNLNNTTMDFVRLDDEEGLIEFLTNKYPGRENLYREQAKEIMNKYREAKKNIRVSKLASSEVPIETKEGTVYIRMPNKVMSRVRDMSMFHKIMKDPNVPFSIKNRFVNPDPDSVDSDLMDLVAPYIDVENYVVEETDRTYAEEWSKYFDDEEYAEAVAQYDFGYQNAVEQLQWEVFNDIFNMYVRLEDSMWNAGVDNIGQPRSKYESDILRSNQLSTYFSAEMGDVVKMFTNEHGVVDHDSLIKHFVNNPNLKVVGIMRSEKGDKPRDIGKVEADEDTPVIKDLDIRSKEDIEELVRLIEEEGIKVGFMTEDNFNVAHRVSYKPYKLPKKADMLYNLLVKSHKMAAVQDLSFTPKVLLNTMFKSVVGNKDVFTEDNILQMGVKTSAYHNGWNMLMGEKMRDLQNILQLQYDLMEGTPGAQEHFTEIMTMVKNTYSNDPELGRIVDRVTYNNQNEILKQLYFFINKFNVMDYTETPMYQNNVFSKMENRENDQSIRNNIDVSKFDKNVMSLVGDFMHSNSVGADSGKINNAMKKFMKDNKHLQVSEEHMRWLYFQNPKMKTRTNLNPLNWNISAARNINTVGKLNGFLMGHHLYGDNVDKGVQRSMNNFFSFKPQSRGDILAQFIFPFTNMASHNKMYWDNNFNNSRALRISHNIMLSAWGAWEEKYDPEQQNQYAQRLARQGMMPIGRNNYLKISPHMEMFKSFNLSQNTAQGMEYRMNPILRTAIGKLRGDERTEWTDAIPFVNRISNYIGGLKERQDVSTYVPSMFGYMQTYEKRNYIPYKNLYKQLYTSKGKYREPSTDPIYTVKSIQYRMRERRYRR